MLNNETAGDFSYEDNARTEAMRTQLEL